MNIGVLALQGCVDPHLEMLDRIGVGGAPVRSEKELSSCDALILPGGESSAMLKLLDRSNFFEPLRDYVKQAPCWGICAGAILLSAQVTHPEQRSFGAISVLAERNFYGSQLDSFKSSVELDGFEEPFQVDFIRAPRLEALSDTVTCLGRVDGQGVMYRQGRTLVSAFHIELTDDTRLHHYFVEQVVSA